MMDQGHNNVLNINVVDLTHFCLICQKNIPRHIQVWITCITEKTYVF